jgi:hypothetical protein
VRANPAAMPAGARLLSGKVTGRHPVGMIAPPAGERRLAQRESPRPVRKNRRSHPERTRGCSPRCRARAGVRRSDPPWRAQSHRNELAGSRPPDHADRATRAHPGESDAGVTKDRRTVESRRHSNWQRYPRAVPPLAWSPAGARRPGLGHRPAAVEPPGGPAVGCDRGARGFMMRRQRLLWAAAARSRSRHRHRHRHFMSIPGHGVIQR